MTLKDILFKVFGRVIVEASNTVIQEGRFILEKQDDGSIRLRVSDGTNTPKDLNYIGESYYRKDDPTTVKVGGIPKNSNLKDKSSAELWEMMLNEYQSVILSSISKDIAEKEVGDPLSGSLTISLSISNPGNIRAYDKALVETTPSILTTQFFDPSSPKTLTLNDYVSNIVQNINVKVTVFGRENESSSKTVTIPYRARMYYGSSEQTSLADKTAVEALGDDQLVSSRQGIFTLSPGYTYFVIPTLIPLSGISFTDIDTSTGKELFGYAMSRQADIEFSNGFINVNHAVFRSDNYLNSITKCKIT